MRLNKDTKNSIPFQKDKKNYSNLQQVGYICDNYMIAKKGDIKTEYK